MLAKTNNKQNKITEETAKKLFTQTTPCSNIPLIIYTNFRHDKQHKP